MAVSTTSSLEFQTKIAVTTTSLPVGSYRVGVMYGWNHNSESTDFVGRLLVDGVPEGETHRQEPKDFAGIFSPTGTNQRHYINRVYYVDTVTPGTIDLEIQYRTDNINHLSSIWEAQLEVWRVE